MFKDFDRRLQRDIQRMVDARLKTSARLSQGAIEPRPIEVQVLSHQLQRYAVWFGGSMLATTSEFYSTYCHTKAQYDEWGPSICRHNPAFGTIS